MKKVIASFIVGGLIALVASASLYHPREYSRAKFLQLVDEVIYLSQHPEEMDNMDDLEFQFQMGEWVKRVDAKLFVKDE